MVVKENYSGVILLEELKEERPSWEASESAWAGALQGMACRRDGDPGSALFGTCTSALGTNARCHEVLVCCWT